MAGVRRNFRFECLKWDQFSEHKLCFRILAPGNVVKYVTVDHVVLDMEQLGSMTYPLSLLPQLVDGDWTRGHVRMTNEGVSRNFLLN